MKSWRLAVLTIAVLLSGVVSAAPESARVYTAEDLDKMFGPAPKSSSDPVDKSRPEDWQFVQQFLDRQYSRIDADRGFDLDRRSQDIAENRVPRADYGYRPVAWGLGYPASTWWQSVWSSYTGTNSRQCRRTVWQPQRSSWNRGGGGNRGSGGSRGALHARR